MPSAWPRRRSVSTGANSRPRPRSSRPSKGHRSHWRGRGRTRRSAIMQMSCPTRKPSSSLTVS
ncbi:hypothetical protein A306_00000432 [Columba livia]|uniref:Uncharacterized protein n=1 Tax=Columba livia TaxID=8932 RepID=A0A2I0LIZ7_COLLI|nr:hypothetical protein A306_00000432 [Columba livia]